MTTPGTEAPAALRRILDQLEDVRPSGTGWTARCPCPGHEDRRASLSIGVGDDGRILLHCHAGCPTVDVVAALGLTMPDLMPRRGEHPKRKRDIVATYDYRDEGGERLFRVCRAQDKGFFVQRPDGKGDWISDLRGVRRVLYRLPELIGADPQRPVFVAEGEKDVDRLKSVGLVATCNVGGADKWRPEYSEHLADRVAIIIPDNDEAGRRHAQQVAASLHGVATSVKVLALPGLPDKGDVSDWLDAGGIAERLLELAHWAPEWQPSPDDARQAEAEKPPRKSQATLLVELSATAELWHTPDGDAYATIPVGSHTENWPVRGKGFRRRLAREYYVEFETAPGAQSLNDALAVVEGQGLFDGEQYDVHVRLAEHQGNIYIDLCNADWQAVEVTPHGWQVINNPPVRFRRAKGMLPLPMPLHDGSIERLRDFINVADEDWPLVAAWLLAALRPRGPFPVLCVHGEHGAAKSTIARVLRDLVDPNIAPIRAEPREPRDLMIQARNGWLINLDNVSRLQPWLQDAICRLSTGGGFTTRALYTDAEEAIFNAMRPVMLNGIAELGTRGDLLDRSLLVSLPRILDKDRRDEEEFCAAFGRDKSAIFGGLLSALSITLATITQLKLPAVPRMADFSKWAVAGEVALGMEKGTFLGAYVGNRAGANELAIESSAVGKVVIDMMMETPFWEGTATDLLAELDRLADDNTRKLTTWPETPRSLSATLKRLAPNLRAIGIDFESCRKKNRRCLMLTRISTEKSVICVTSVTDPKKDREYQPVG